MKKLENRVVQLERTQGNADLNGMTDVQLKAYIQTLERRTPSWWKAVLASILRHPNTLPVVVNDLDHADGTHAIN